MPPEVPKKADATSPPFDRGVTPRLLITVHGIRTFGHWQEKLEQKLCSGIEVTDQVCHYRYGFYTIIAFLIPPFRWLATKRFQSWLLHQANEQSWSRIDIVAHSFGTHLVGWGLLRLPRERRPSIHTVIFAASVLRSSFPVHELLATCVARLVNECGIRDNVLVLNQMFVLLTGMAGRIGFIGMQGNSFRNRYFNVAHSGYFQESGSEGLGFIGQHWMPLLQSTNGIIPHDERTQRGMRDITVALLNIAEPIKIAVYVLPIILVLFYVNGLRLKAERQTVIANNARLEAERQRDIANKSRSEAEHQTAIANESRLEAQHQRDIANNSRSEAEHQTAIANESRLEAQHQTINDLIANSRVSQDSDPEISVLAATEAVSIAWQNSDSLKQKAEDQLHRAILASQVRLTLDDQRGPIKSVAWSPDGTRLATGSGDNTVEIRDATTGRRLRTLNAHPGFYDLAWRPDSKRLATVSSDNTTTLWDTATGKELLILRGQTEEDHRICCSVAWSPDGKRLVTGSGSSAAIVWDADTGNELLTLKGSGMFVHRVAWSPDGKRIAIGGFRGALATWDAVTGKPLPLGSSLGQGDVSSVSWSPDGRWLAAGNDDGLASAGGVWDATTGKQFAILPGRGVGFSSLAWSPDSKRLAIGRGNTATVWDADTREDVLTLRGHSNAVLSVSWRSDDELLATGSADGTTKVWNTAPTGTELVNLGAHSGAPVFSLAWSPNSRRLAIARSDRAIVIWDSITRKESSPIRSSVNVGRIAWSTDGKRLVGASGKMWDPATGKELLTLDNHDSQWQEFAWSPGVERVATAGMSGSVWDVASGQGLVALERLDFPPTRLAWSADGKRLAGACDRMWAVWDSSTGKKISSVSMGTNFVNSVTWSPDGEWLAVEASDGEELWNIQTHQKFRTLPHGGPLRGVVWSPDSTRLATGQDNTARIWDRATGQELITLEGQEGFIFSMAWSPDGKRLATGDTNDVQVYAMDIRDLMALARERVTARPSDAACLKYLHVDKCPPVPAFP